MDVAKNITLLSEGSGPIAEKLMVEPWDSLRVLLTFSFKLSLKYKNSRKNGVHSY